MTLVFSGRFLYPLFSLFLILPVPALGWGPSGHSIIATIAEQQLDVKTHAEVRRLLAILGASSLADVANWADDVRDDPSQRALSRATARLHYVNFSDSQCHYDPTTICRKGQCVVAAISRFAVDLGNRSASDIARAEALRFLVHFVGDVHQPLHAGYRTDRGGNNHQVRFHGIGSNLHSIWDSKILASRHLRWQDYVRRLQRQPISDDDAEEPVGWAEQSCRVTRDDGVYPQGRTIDKAYLERMLPINDRQIRLAGTRLARLLERSLD